LLGVGVLLFSSINIKYKLKNKSNIVLDSGVKENELKEHDVREVKVTYNNKEYNVIL